MVCIHCSGKTRIINSRPQKRLDQTWRRHQCLACGTVFTTTESVDYSGSIVVRQADKSLQPLERDKLFVSLVRACGHRESAISDAAGLAATILAKARKTAVNGLLERQDIIKAALEVLKRFDNAAAVAYAAYHQT